MVLHHTQDWRASLKEIARVVKSDGYYILDECALPGGSTKTFKRLGSEHGLYSIVDVVYMLGKNGFELIHSEQGEHRYPVDEYLGVFHKPARQSD